MFSLIEFLLSWPVLYVGAGRPWRTRSAASQSICKSATEGLQLSSPYPVDNSVGRQVLRFSLLILPYLDSRVQNHQPSMSDDCRKRLRSMRTAMRRQRRWNGQQRSAPVYHQASRKLRFIDSKFASNKLRTSCRNILEFQAIPFTQFFIKKKLLYIITS